MARPRKTIDKTEFEKLCGLQCTKEEIQDWFDATDKTIDAWCKRTYGEHFSVVFRKKRGMGKISLRRKQWKLADSNASMAIFLGKQFLGQSDNPEGNVDTEDAESYFAEAGIGEQNPTT